jgi:ribosomal protein S27AE
MHFAGYNLHKITLHHVETSQWRYRKDEGTCPLPVRINRREAKVLGVLKYYEIDANGKISQLSQECISEECKAAVFMLNHFFYFGGTRIWTQDFMLTRWALYCFEPHLILLWLFWKMRSCELFAQAGLELNCNPDLSLPSIWV